MQTKEEATKEIIKGLKDMLRRSTHKDKEIINRAIKLLGGEE